MIGTYCTYQSVIQLLTRKGARCAFDVSNSYQKTKTKKKQCHMICLPIPL